MDSFDPVLRQTPTNSSLKSGCLCELYVIFFNISQNDYELFIVGSAAWLFAQAYTKGIYNKLYLPLINRTIISILHAVQLIQSEDDGLS